MRTFVSVIVYFVVFFIIEAFFPLLWWVNVILAVGLIAANLVVIRINKKKKLKKPKPELIEEKKEWNSKSILLIVVGSVFATVFWFFQSTWLAVISYVVPLVILCIVLTREDQLFNFNLFIGGMLVFLIAPSFIGKTLSAVSPSSMPQLFDVTVPEVPSFDGLIGASNQMATASSLHDFAIALKNFIDALTAFVTVALPLVLVALVAYSMYSHPDKVPGLLLKVVIVIAVIAFVYFLFPGLRIQLSALSMTGENGLVSTLTNYAYAVLPFSMSVLVIVIGYISRYSNFYVLMADRKKRVESVNFVEKKFNWGFFTLIILILLWAFARFLISTESLGFNDPGVLALYLVIILGASLPILLGSLPVYKGTFFSNVYGVLIGIAALFLSQQAITAFAYNYNVLSFALDLSSSIPNTLFSIGDNFLFVATTESILFHIAIPSVAIVYLYRKTRTKDKRYIDSKVREKMREIKYEIRLKRSVQSVLEEKKKLTKEVLEIAAILPEVEADVEEIKRLKKLSAKKVYLEEKIKGLEEEFATLEDYLGKYSRVSWGRMVLSEWKNAPYFIIVVLLVPNLLFAFYHWFRSGGFNEFGQLNPPPDLVLWVAEGPFLVFVISGIILTLISFKYGFYSAILTHGTWNSIIIIISSISVGVV